MNLLDEINKIVPDALKKQIKDLNVKFSEQALPAIAAPVVAPTNLTTIETKLVDGTTLSVDKMEVGGMANIISEAGTLPAPDGAYEAEDGTMITVAGGLITAITPKAEEPMVEPVVDANAAMSALTARLAALESKFAGVEVSMASVSDATKVTLSAISSIISTSVAEPIEKPKTLVNKQFAQAALLKTK